MREIQEKYANDQQRQAEELQKVYAEIGFNPITGCLPLLIQMPIFVALFQVLQEMGGRTEGMIYSFYSILPTLIDSPSAVFSQGFCSLSPMAFFFYCSPFVPSFLRYFSNEEQIIPRRIKCLS